MRRAAVALVCIAVLAFAARADGFVLGFNDRWDTNYPYAGLVKKIGGEQARVFVTVSRARSAGYWRQLDTEVHGLVSHGVQPFWCLSDIPSYGGRNTTNKSLWADAARKLVSHYGGARAIEIGNEPNAAPGWSPATYAGIFRAAYGAIKAVDPTRHIISAGIPTILGWRTWFARFAFLTHDLHYTTGMHEYALGVTRTLSDLAAFRQIRPGWPVRVTEIGINSDKWGLKLQAYLLPLEVAALAHHGVAHIAIHDLIGYRDGWAMVDKNLNPKPVFYAIRSLMG